MYLARFVRFVGLQIRDSVHVAFALVWANKLLREHSVYIKQNHTEFAAELQALQRAIRTHYDDMYRVCSSNTHMLAFLCHDQSNGPPAAQSLLDS